MRYTLANFFLGNIPDIKKLCDLLGLNAKIPPLIRAFISNKPRDKLYHIKDVLEDFKNDHNPPIPPKVIDLFNAFFFFITGQGALKEFYDPYSNQQP